MNSPNASLFPASPKIESGSGFSRVMFTVPEKFTFCEGHFPGAPLVPGAVLAAWMRETAKLVTPPATLCQVKKLKFRAPVAPHDPVSITATQTAADVRVVLESGERLCADALFDA